MRQRSCYCTASRHHSRMWQPLIDRLAERYRMIAPDYPGFGSNDAPPADGFTHTFDNLDDFFERYTEVAASPATRSSCRTTADTSACVWRCADPNGSAHSSCTTRSAMNTALVRCGKPGGHSGPTVRATKQRSGKTSFPRRSTSAARWQQHPTANDPDLWTDELAFRNRPRQHDIQTDLFTTTAPTWRAIRCGNNGYATRNPRCLWCGAATIPPSR